MCLCTVLCMSVYMHVFVSVCNSTCVCLPVCMSVCLCICVCALLSCMLVCMSVCLFVYTCSSVLWACLCLIVSLCICVQLEVVKSERNLGPMAICGLLGFLSPTSSSHVTLPLWPCTLFCLLPLSPLSWSPLHSSSLSSPLLLSLLSRPGLSAGHVQGTTSSLCPLTLIIKTFPSTISWSSHVLSVYRGCFCSLLNTVLWQEKAPAVSQVKKSITLD